MSKITRYRGDTYSEVFTLKVDGSAVDLTAATAVRFTFLKSTETIEIDAIIDPDPTTGKIYIPFTEEQVDTVGSYSYDISTESPEVITGRTVKTTYVLSTMTLADDLNKK